MFSAAVGRPRAVRVLGPSAGPHASRGHTPRSPISKPGLGSSHRGEARLLEPDLYEAPEGSLRVHEQKSHIKGTRRLPVKMLTQGRALTAQNDNNNKNSSSQKERRMVWG